ncbi:hypothetical protein ACSBR2_025923 [Camellia fascicularis]
MTAARGTMGYIAPEVFSRNFGMCQTNQIFISLDKGEELGFQINEEGDAKIVKKLTIAGLWCIQWCPIDQPSMKVVVQMLEGDEGTLTVPPSPFSSTNPMPTRRTMGDTTFTSELDVIVEYE